MLQFGNKNLKKSEEIMGLLYGFDLGIQLKFVRRSRSNTVRVVKNPSTKPIMLYSVKQMIKSFPKVWNLVAFILHIRKWDFISSQSEIKDLLYFIQEKNIPEAIAIIGDHAQLEEADNTGFQVFHLNDPAKGTSVFRKTLELQIAPPEGLSIFKTTKLLIKQAESISLC